jgi:hypothetical protein
MRWRPLFRTFQTGIAVDKDTLFGFKTMALIAGFAGVLLGIVVRRQFDWWEALSAAAAGIGCVLFVAPAIVEWFTLTGRVEYLVAWLSGMCGLYMVDFLFKVARDPLSFYDRFRGGRP